MKLLKRIFAFAVCLMILAALAVPAYAMDQRVYDGAGLFSQEEAQQITAAIEQLREHTGIDAAVVTAADRQGRSTQGFAEECYVTANIGLGSEKSGFLYFIDMQDRVPHISTVGGAISIFSDDNINAALDHAYDYLASGDYAGSAQVILSDFTAYYDDAVSRGWTYDQDSGVWTAPERKRSLSIFKLLGSAILSALAALGPVNSVKRKYAMKDETAAVSRGTAAALAMAGIAFAYANKKDDLINSSTVRRALPIQKTSGRGKGGSGSPFGHSTTHTGAGGMTFGGGTGRKF